MHSEEDWEEEECNKCIHLCGEVSVSTRGCSSLVRSGEVLENRRLLLELIVEGGCGDWCDCESRRWRAGWRVFGVEDNGSSSETQQQ